MGEVKSEFQIEWEEALAKNSSNLHSDLVNILLKAVSMPGCRAWKCATGVATTDSGHKISYGLKGSADITGIVRCKSGTGVRLEVECKTGAGKLSTEQKNFRSMINMMGGLHIEARDVDSVVATVKHFQDNR